MMESKLLTGVLLLIVFSMMLAVIVSATGSRGITQAAIPPTSPITSLAGCTNPQQCREIDEVWQKSLGFFIRGNNLVWDVPAAGWRAFTTLYLPISGSAPSAAALPLDFCFPVAQDSFKANTHNFGSPRDNGARCHAGIDLFTKSDGKIVAVDDGQIVNIHNFLGDCRGGPGDAVLIYHPKIQGGVTINYGEMNRNDIQVSIGQNVRRGQYLGKATTCQSEGNTMLHFELYQGRVSATQRWDDLPPALVTAENQCANDQIFLEQKPTELLNPTWLLDSLQGNFCPPS